MTAEDKGIVPLMISIMQSKRIGLTILEAAAEVIAADARFNTWILQDVKTADTSEDHWMQLLAFVEEIYKRGEVAVAEFHNGGTNESLALVLTKIAAELNGAPIKRPFWGV